MVRILAIVTLVFCIGMPVAPSSAWAADIAAEGGEASKAFGPRKQIATIVFAGLAGAILGLSTLSFYGRPQDKLSNIAVGFAIGVISGTVFTTYKAATQPREFYDNGQPGASNARPLETEMYLAQATNAGRASGFVAPIFGANWSF